MSTLTVDSKFPRHTKVAPLSDAAFRLHVAAMSYCAEHETDGFMPESEVTTLTKHQDKAPLIKELEAAKGPRENGHPLWRRSARADVTGWDIHDYLEWNQSHDALEAERAIEQEKRARNRSRMKSTRGVPKTDVHAHKQCTIDALTAHETVHGARTASPASLSLVGNSKQESGSSGDPEPTSNRARRGRRGAGVGEPIPDDWTAAAKDYEFAANRGWDVKRAAEEADRFRAHHMAKGTLSLNWSASWITWVTQGIRFDRIDARASGVQRVSRPGPGQRAVQPAGEEETPDDAPMRVS